MIAFRLSQSVEHIYIYGARTIGIRTIGMEDNWHAENWHGGQ